MTNYRYPRDEFDAVPEDAPTGVHRVPRSAWHKVVPFVVVAVVFAVVAYVGVTVWSGSLGGGSASADDGSGATSTSTSASTKKADKDGGTSSGKETGGATDGTIDGTGAAATDDSADSADSGDVDTSLAIIVKNGSKQTGTTVTGLAATGATALKGAGFTNVSAADYAGAALSESVVYYVADGDAATAKKVASTLGVDDVEQVTSLKGGAPVIAVLVHALS